MAFSVAVSGRENMASNSNDVWGGTSPDRTGHRTRSPLFAVPRIPSNSPTSPRRSARTQQVTSQPAASESLISARHDTSKRTGAKKESSQNQGYSPMPVIITYSTPMFQRKGGLASVYA
ncbi:hypothetical protein BDW22DRAFT_1345063 [Trametopsis cervina]|nr:hypothetical protein BDW22DRAFT_1345063 [Trametopsis cervina]